MKIIVTGSNGQLGRSIKDSAASTADEYLFYDVEELDITDPDSVMNVMGREKPDVIINCAAYTDVERAEDDEARAEAINASGPENLAAAAAATGATLIHVSTDYVFGGNTGNTPRAEDEPVNPTGVYGVTKLHGEEAVARSGCEYIIIRTAWLYSEYGRNFVKTMLRLTAEREELNVVCDQAGTPTYARDLADAIVGIVEFRAYSGNTGIYHYSDEGIASWYDFTCAIAAMAGHDGCRIRPCRSAEYPSRVVRPPYSVLDKSKFKATFKVEIPWWADSLKRCINNLTK